MLAERDQRGRADVELGFVPYNGGMRPTAFAASRLTRACLCVLCVALSVTGCRQASDVPQRSSPQNESAYVEVGLLDGVPLERRHLAAEALKRDGIGCRISGPFVLVPTRDADEALRILRKDSADKKYEFMTLEEFQRRIPVYP